MALRLEGHVATASVQGPALGEVEGLVIHRPLDAGRPAAVQAHREAGTRVVIDEDDDLTRAEETGNGILQELMSPARRARHQDAIEEADALVTSTPQLAEVYGPLARESHVCRNRIPAWVAGVRFYGGRGEPVRVGWTGLVRTHAPDLEWIRPAAGDMLRGALLCTVGELAAAAALGVDQVEAWPPQPNLEDYYQLMVRADVGIVPLASTGFNRSKSWLKALEYLTLGIPVVARDLPEQRELLAETGAGFLVDTPGEMAEAVQELVRDPDLRTAMGTAARVRAASVNPPRAAEWMAALCG
jgi:glycosyltransferase involved in cell wall biosynthesis